MAFTLTAAGWPAGGGDGTVRIWDAATGEQRATLTGHTSVVRRWRSHPDGTWLATGGDDGTVRIWDAATGEQRATLTGHTSCVSAVAFAPDGTWLATGSDDGTVRIWDAATGEHLPTLTGHTGGAGGGDRTRTAPGWPPAAATGRCGSGTPPPASISAPSPATPAG